MADKPTGKKPDEKDTTKVLKFPSPPESVLDAMLREASPEFAHAQATAPKKKRRKGAGRPPTLSVELIGLIAEAVRTTGTFPVRAAVRHGVPESTFYSWMQKAETGKASTLYVRLKAAIAVAEAEHEQGLVVVATFKDPVKVLERRYKERWKPEGTLNIPNLPDVDSITDALATKLARLTHP